MVAVTSLAAFFGFAWTALAISTATLFTFIATGFVAWVKCGRDVLPLRSVVLVAPYVLKKLGLYRQIAAGRTEAEWIRTDRSKSE
jgi:hypothetical protein